MIPALPHLKMPRTVEERQEKFQLKDKPVTRQVLLDYMMDLLLLPYRSAAPSTLAELFVATAALGKLLGDGVERIIMGLSLIHI